MKPQSRFEVWATVPDNPAIGHIEHCLACNDLIIRNHLSNLPLSDALQLWYFLMQKYPFATVLLAPRNS